MKKLVLYILAIFLSACTTYQAVDIEVLTTSTYQINPSIQKIIIINYAKEQASNVGHKTYKQDLTYFSTDRRKKKVSNDTIRIDNTSSTAIHKMYDQLVKSKIFESVEIGHEAPRSPTSLSTILELVNENPNDVILVLDSLFYTDDLTNFHYKKDSTATELKTQTRSQWLVYQIKNLTEPYHYATSETLYWDLVGSSRASCVLEAIQSNTKLSAGKITPQWVRVDRLYYRGTSSTYRKVEKAIEVSDWDTTGPLWMSLYTHEKKNTKQKGRMAFNMALFFEMRNDLETAIMWLETASKIFTEKDAQEELMHCKLYTEALIKCLINKEILDQHFKP